MKKKKEQVFLINSPFVPTTIQHSTYYLDLTSCDFQLFPKSSNVLNNVDFEQIKAVKDTSKKKNTMDKKNHTKKGKEIKDF